MTEPATAALPEGVTVAEDAWRIDAGDDAHYGVLIRVRTITGNPYWWLICPADATLYLEQLPEAMLDCHSESCDWLRTSTRRPLLSSPGTSFRRREHDRFDP